ncbi:MAG: FMN-binding protein [Firmicutes bacterium]|nr:FMN-binding protein [Bacillota bacterium]
MKSLAPFGKTLLPVLLTGLIFLGCTEAPVMKEIPARLQIADVSAAETEPFTQNSTGSPGAGTAAARPGIGSSSGNTRTAAAGIGNAAARTQTAYTKPASGYKDGTYTGTATGFGGPVSVQVVIRSGKIADITITSASKEDAQFLQMARGVIPKILSAQTPNVDAVSGATYSSNGIINAVKNALAKAGNVAAANHSSGGLGNSGTPGSNTDPSPSASDSQNQQGEQNQNPDPQPAGPSTGSRYADGTFTGSATGFGGPVQTQIVIKDGVITAIAILSADLETPSYLNFSKLVIDRMLSKQSTDVDVVAGATYTSWAIINGVKEALSKAAVNASEDNTDPTPSNPAGVQTPGGNTDPAADTPSGDPTPGGNTDPSTDTPSGDPTPGGNPDPTTGEPIGDPTPANPPEYPTPGDNTDPAPGDNPDPGDTPETPPRKYVDGTYSASASGWGGIIKLSVRIENDQIKTITITSAASETPSYMERAKIVINRIIKNQSIQVDTVTGATYSSRGIIDAVKGALKQASDAAEQARQQAQEAAPSESSSQEQNTGSGTGESSSQASSIYYEDGDYTGTANGWGGDVTVKLTIKDGLMKAIEIISAAGETPAYLKAANKVTTRILQKQKTDVDIVTGATYTSRAIINAVKEAAQKAERTINSNNG